MAKLRPGYRWGEAGWGEANWGEASWAKRLILAGVGEEKFDRQRLKQDIVTGQVK